MSTRLATPNPKPCYMPHPDFTRPFNGRAWSTPQQYSLLPVSDDPSTAMTLKDHLIALKSRSTDQTTRIDSPPNPAAEEVVEDDGTVYRVYKKRWIGVAIIMLLNIVSSWRYVCFPMGL